MTGPPPPISITLITGFLGAGKTTLLNALLHHEDMKHTAVIVNEFGDIGLDHLFVESVDEGIMEMSSGCLCCTIRGDLVNTLEDLLRRLDNGRAPPFNRVLIESTGLADPAPVLATLMQHPYLVMRYQLSGVVTVIDAIHGMGTLDAHEESLKQAAVADRLVISKTDILANGNDLDILKNRLKILNPAAPVFLAADGVRPDMLLEAGPYDPAARPADVERWINQEAYSDDHHGHGHDVNRHDGGISAFCLTREAPVRMSALKMFLDLLRSEYGKELLRLKGIVQLDAEPDRPLVVHGVHHALHPPVRLDRWPDDDRRTRLVFIMLNVKEATINALLDAFLDPVTPESAAIAAELDNPLSLNDKG